jgi:hypothetical protein
MPKKLVNFNDWNIESYKDQIPPNQIARLIALFVANSIKNNNEYLSAEKLVEGLKIFDPQTKTTPRQLSEKDLKKLKESEIIHITKVGNCLDGLFLQCLKLEEITAVVDSNDYGEVVKTVTQFYRKDLANKTGISSTGLMLRDIELQNPLHNEIPSGETEDTDLEDAQVILSSGYRWQVIGRNWELPRERALRVLAILVENYILNDNDFLICDEVLKILNAMHEQNLPSANSLSATVMKAFRQRSIVESIEGKGFKLQEGFAGHLNEQEILAYKAVIRFYAPDAFPEEVSDLPNPPPTQPIARKTKIGKEDFAKWQVVKRQNDFFNDCVARVLALLVENFMERDNQVLSAADILRAVNCFEGISIKDKSTLTKFDLKKLKDAGLAVTNGSGYCLAQDFLEKSDIQIPCVTTLKTNKRTASMLNPIKVFSASQVIKDVAGFYPDHLLNEKIKSREVNGTTPVDMNNNNNNGSSDELHPSVPKDSESEKTLETQGFFKKPKLGGYSSWHFSECHFSNRSTVTFAILLERHCLDKSRFLSADMILEGLKFYKIKNDKIEMNVDTAAESLMKKELKEFKNAGFVISHPNGYKIADDFQMKLKNSKLSSEVLEGIRDICLQMAVFYPDSELAQSFIQNSVESTC